MISITPEHYRGGGVGWPAEVELVQLHSKREKKEREEDGVWRNAAVQTALWYCGYSNQCDSLWLHQCGDQSDVHPSGPVVFLLSCGLCVRVFGMCVFKRKREFKCVSAAPELDDFCMLKAHMLLISKYLTGKYKYEYQQKSKNKKTVIGISKFIFHIMHVSHAHVPYEHLFMIENLIAQRTRGMKKQIWKDMLQFCNFCFCLQPAAYDVPHMQKYPAILNQVKPTGKCY